MVEVLLGSLLAGLGLFFVGLKIMNTHLMLVTGRRIRIFVLKWTDNFWLASFWGSIIGFLTQSTTALAFTVAGLIESGMLTVRKAMPIVFWANVGGTVVVFLAIVNIKIFVLYSLCVFGLAYAFERPAQYRYIVGIIFGIALLYFGLQMVSDSTEPLKELDWFKSMFFYIKDSYILAFLIGALLSIIAQSSIAPTIIAIAMTKAGLLNVEQTIMLMYGTNVGSSVLTALLTTGIKGRAKQLVMSQVLFNIAGAVILIPLFYAEVYFDFPLVREIAFFLGQNIEQQMAYIFMIFNLVAAILLSICINPLYRLLEKLWPPTQVEELSKLKYVQSYSVNNPEIALDLAEKEQLRIFKLLQIYISMWREEKDKIASGLTVDTLHKAFNNLSKELQDFLNEYLQNNLAQQTIERLVHIQKLQNYIISLEDTMFHFMVTVANSSDSAALKSLVHKFIEALDTLLLTAQDALESDENSDIDMLISITGDRGELMKKIRQNYLGNEDDVGSMERTLLVEITATFERVVWVLGQIGKSLQINAKYRN